jgi:hypothetical protein
VLRFLQRAAGPVRVALESTGLYGLDLALCLHQARVAVMVANPRAVRHFAQAMMQRSKNDQLDAAVLREQVAQTCSVGLRFFRSMSAPRLASPHDQSPARIAPPAWRRSSPRIPDSSTTSSLRGAAPTLGAPGSDARTRPSHDTP